MALFFFYLSVPLLVLIIFLWDSQICKRVPELTKKKKKKKMLAMQVFNETNYLTYWLMVSFVYSKFLGC